MKITTEKNMIRLFSPSYDKETVKRCNRLSMRWSKARRDWFFPNNYINKVSLAQTFPGLIQMEKVPIKELVVPEFLMNHQADALRIAARRNRYGFFHDTGTGKTITALEVYRHHGVKTLVICPLSLIEGAWMEEVHSRYPDIDAVNLWEAKKKSPARLSEALEKNFCIINYESFRTMHKMLAGKGFEMAILDESARIRTVKKGSTSSLIIDFCDNMKYAYELSGVPAPNAMYEYWSQIRILDPVIWGKSFYKWRTKYFYPSGYGGYTWEVKPNEKDKLMADIKTVAEYVDKEDVLDLPGLTESIRVFQLSTEERKHYKNIKNDLVTIIDSGKTITSPSAVTAIMKLRQISSGFILNTTEIEVNGKIKKKKEVFKLGNSKLKELIALLEDIGKKQVIIWIEFQEEARIVADALNKKGWDSGILNGTISEKQKQITLKAFKANELQYIVCHPGSVGYGHTLVNCSESLYYSSSYSYDKVKQSKDRIYRKGQNKKCSYSYLVADKTIDMVILKAVQSKKKTSSAILDYLKN